MTKHLISFPAEAGRGLSLSAGTPRVPVRPRELIRDVYDEAWLEGSLMPKLEVLEDEIGRKLAEAARTGELQSAQGYGKPFEHDPGWEQTPEEFRLPFKMLKNAGVVPAEVELFHERSRLHTAVSRALTDDERRLLQRELSEVEQKIALRLEALRATGAR